MKVTFIEWEYINCMHTINPSVVSHSFIHVIMWLFPPPINIFIYISSFLCLHIYYKSKSNISYYLLWARHVARY